jgi:hypothetical protein
MFMQKVRPRTGFTLVKALVVILVFAAVVGVSVPGILWARKQAARTTTMDNLTKCAKAVHLAHDQFKKFPPYFGIYGKSEETTPRTFHHHLAHFVEGPLYVNPNAAAIVPTYLAPMDLTQTNGGAGAVNYAVNLRLFYTQGGLGNLAVGSTLVYPKMPGSFQDGVSQTLLFATKYMNCGADGGSLWLDPGNNEISSPTAATFGASMGLWQKAPTQAACNPRAGTAMSFTVDAIQIALCDASVRTVKSDISNATWQAVHTPGGSDSPSGDGDRD